jgi:hypothetical protein
VPSARSGTELVQFDHDFFAIAPTSHVGREQRRGLATGPTELRSHDGQMEQREQDILHARVSVGQVFSVA